MQDKTCIAYATFPNPPSFGGGKLFKYADGLTINGNAIDISKFSQKMPTPQILAIGKSSTITLKIFDMQVMLLSISFPLYEYAWKHLGNFKW